MLRSKPYAHESNQAIASLDIGFTQKPWRRYRGGKIRVGISGSSSSGTPEMCWYVP